MIDNYIAVGIFVLAIVGIIALIVYNKKKNNETFTFEDFLSTYHMNLLSALQDVVQLLMINIDAFDSKEDYEKAIISTTVEKLKTNCEDFGINTFIFKLVDEAVLIEALYTVLYTDKIQVFIQSLNKETVDANPALFDAEVVAAVEEAPNAEDSTTVEEVVEIDSVVVKDKIPVEDLHVDGDPVPLEGTNYVVGGDLWDDAMDDDFGEDEVASIASEQPNEEVFGELVDVDAEATDTLEGKIEEVVVVEEAEEVGESIEEGIIAPVEVFTEEAKKETDEASV